MNEYIFNFEDLPRRLVLKVNIPTVKGYNNKVNIYSSKHWQ